MAAVAARHAARISGRRAAGGRRRDSDVPLLRASSAGSPATRRRSATGAIEGVAGPEAANNAAAAGTLVPLLTLGLPTSATAAILLAAFQQYGLQPGPLLFTRDAQLVWGLIASLYIGNVMLLVLNLPLVGLWVRLLTIPRPYLHAGILVLASVGAYSVNRSIFDVGLLYAIGVAGFVMRRWQIPLAPAVIGLILGPMAEQQLRRALAAAEGSWAVFVTRPIAAGGPRRCRHAGAASFGLAALEGNPAAATAFRLKPEATLTSGSRRTEQLVLASAFSRKAADLPQPS